MFTRRAKAYSSSGSVV